jgi:hypothetical protein
LASRSAPADQRSVGAILVRGADPAHDAAASFTGAIVKEILNELRLVYFTPDETKDAGFIETDHFGVRFDQRASHVDLTGIPQCWLRNLVWEYLAAMLQSPRCPRSGRQPNFETTSRPGEAPCRRWRLRGVRHRRRHASSPRELA